MLRKELYPSDSGALYIMAFIMLIVGQVVILVFTGLTTDLPDWAQWASLVVNQAAFMIAVFFFLSYKGINPIKAAGFKRKMTGKQYAMLPAISILTIITSLPIALLINMLMRNLGYNETVSFPARDTLPLLLLSVVVIAVFPAIGEEFLFRNGILKGLKKRGYIFSIVMSATLFSLMHGNISQLPHTLFVGAILALVMLITGNLLAPIIIHFTNNFIAVLLDYAMTNISTDGVNDYVFLAILIFMIFNGAIGLVMSLKYFVKLEMNKREGANDREVNSSSFVDKYVGTVKFMLALIFSGSRRKQLKSSVNSTLKSFDYDIEEEVELDDFMKVIIETKKNSNGSLIIGICGASILVIIATVGGFMQ